MNDIAGPEYGALWESVVDYDSGERRGFQPLDRLCTIAAQLLDAQTVVVSLVQGGLERIIASAGVDVQIRSRSRSIAGLPEVSTDDIILADAHRNSAVQTYSSYLGLPSIGFFLRTVVVNGADHVVKLIAASSAPGNKPKSADLKLLEDIKKLLRSEFELYAPVLTDPKSDVTLALSLEQARQQITAARLPTLLMDQNLIVRHANASMSGLLGMPVERLDGLPHDQINVPMMAARTLLYRHALERRVSTPDFEIVIGPNGDRHRVFQVNASPFSPLDTRDYFLIVTARDVTELNMRERDLALAVDRRHEPARKPIEPSLAFLRETLVARRTIRGRKAVHYLTLRSWRSSIRDWQIKALKALKANIPDEMPATIAEEICTQVSALFGITAFNVIVPVPCGHTREGPCLSLEIARALGRAMDIPVVQAITAKPQKGTSHPKENMKRPPLMLAHPISGPALVVDDVATSGADIEEAVNLLKGSAGSVMAVAWISGDAN